MPQKDPEKRAAYIKQWNIKNQEKLKESWAKYRATHREVLQQRNKKYRDRHSKDLYRRRLIWRKNNREKYLAHKAVENAVKHGVLTRQPCEKCGREKSVGHHQDYSKPLIVIWLCQRCHRKVHEES